MKSCPACASSNDDATRFCTSCGASLQASAPPGLQGSPIAAVGVIGGNTPMGGMTPTPGSPSAGRISSNPTPGMIIDGKYAVERVLGEGAMGIVYLARDVITETKVVIKSIRAEFADNPEFQARAIEEGRVLARIDHPNVVRLNAVVVEPGQLYLVMQYIEGNSLDKFLDAYRTEGKMVPLDEALRIFRMMVQGLAAAHREGVIHRDIKPANILVRAKDGVVKISDFGIAKTSDAIRTGRFKTLGVIGSPAYMAPEQRRGERDLDRRADIYSLGIVFFEMLTGRLPFVAATEPELYRLHSEAAIPSVRSLRPELPTSLDEILARACAKDRRHRFDTCEELDAALAHGGLPIMRSVPPTVMATQGLPSVPPAPPPPHGSAPPPPPYGSSPPAPPYGSTPPPAHPHGYGSSPPGAPHGYGVPQPGPPRYGSSPPGFPAPASGRNVWKIVALSGGAVLVVAGIAVGLAISSGFFDDPEPALVDPPRARDAGAPAPQPARVDAGPPAPLPQIPLPQNPPAKKR